MARRSAQGKARMKGIRHIDMLLVVVIVILVAYIAYPAVESEIKGAPAGKTISGINSPLTAAELGVINNAPNSYFEAAGEMLLNGSLPGVSESNGIYYGSGFEVVLVNGSSPVVQPFTYGGKPSVIYAGATSCIYCGEARWAMAMALSRFGSFNALYTGYSSFGDADVPTLYWAPNEYRLPNTVTYGNSYSSGYVNFFSADYDSNITQGFQLPSMAHPIAFFVAHAPNQSYRGALAYLNGTNYFEGTPFTLWGAQVDRGAVSVVFGASSNQSATNSVPLTYMTHKQILDMLAGFNSTFAYEEYAGADVYIAQLCPSIGNSAPVCSLPAISAFERKMGLA